MYISKPLVLNAINQFSVANQRINNEEWAIEILADENGALLFVDSEDIEADDNLETDIIVYLVDEEHTSIVEDWMVDARAELLETQNVMKHLNLNLKTEIEIKGTVYNIFLMYSAD